MNAIATEVKLMSKTVGQARQGLITEDELLAELCLSAVLVGAVLPLHSTGDASWF